MKRLLLIAFAFVVVGLVVWKMTDKPALPAPVVTSEGYTLWSPAHLKAGLSHKDFTLINVHIPPAGKIAGTDMEIPYDQITANLARLPQDKNARIVLYCSSGRMSEIAANELVKLGYTRVISLDGGMQAWQTAGEKLITP